MPHQDVKDLQAGNIRTLAKCITLVENERPRYETLLQALPFCPGKPVIGITGPPGAGKSSLTDALIGELLLRQKKVAVLCVDPSSPFHHGALLGDRIRMSNWYLHPEVFIRSFSTRGSLGGLHPQIIAITDIVKASAFDVILVETVGVGQSEVEIARLADITVVVLVPEAGDEIQVMKTGLMEVADLFVINKSDRPGADSFAHYLQQMLHHTGSNRSVPVIKTISTQKKGIGELTEQIFAILAAPRTITKNELLAEKAFQLLLAKKAGSINKSLLYQELNAALQLPDFNLYRFIAAFDDRESSK